MASVDTTFLGHRAGLHPADYAYLRDLDRAGWAWEWLRRNPEFAALRAESGPNITARCALFVGVDEVMERQLRRGDQDENAPSNRMRIARGCGGAGRSPEPT